MRKVRTEELAPCVRRLVSEGEDAFPELFAPWRGIMGMLRLNM
jgi:hypothetical protein